MFQSKPPEGLVELNGPAGHCWHISDAVAGKSLARYGLFNPSPALPLPGVVSNSYRPTGPTQSMQEKADDTAKPAMPSSANSSVASGDKSTKVNDSDKRSLDGGDAYPSGTRLALVALALIFSIIPLSVDMVSALTRAWAGARARARPAARARASIDESIDESVTQATG